jgi:peptidoglycan/LPS O-acetylase OafA/YrhL
MISAETRKDYSLEALRGLASITVLLYHVMVGFFPERAGTFANFEQSKAINTQAWYGIIYGPSAVTFFFVLSGFVLTRPFFASGDANQIFRNALKRWPRLALPVLIAVISSWVLFKFHLYSFLEAGAITKSPWLSTFANAGGLPSQMDFFDAFRQGTYRTFFRGDSYYDSNLWTMRFEFIGSFMAFGLVLIMGPARRPIFRAYFVLIAIGICYYVNTWYVAFPVGVALAAYIPQRSDSIPGPVGLALVALAVYCLGFTGVMQGAFLPLSVIWPSWVSSIYLNIVGAAILMSTVLMCSSIHRQLSVGWGAVLGMLSFPLYLVHILVLCSVGCAVLLALEPRVAYPLAQMGAAFATIVGSIVVAYPLAIINQWWIERLNVAVNSLTDRKKQIDARDLSSLGTKQAADAGKASLLTRSEVCVDRVGKAGRLS